MQTCLKSNQIRPEQILYLYNLSLSWLNFSFAAIKKAVVRTRFVQNGVYLLDHIEICLIIGVFNTSPPPWDIGQLTCWQCISNIASS